VLASLAFTHPSTGVSSGGYTPSVDAGSSGRGLPAALSVIEATPV
jgi:hypothetical protein